MNKKLYRNTSNKMIGGVCSGIADYFNIDPTLVRLIALGLLFLFESHSWVIVAYIALMVVLPAKKSQRSIAEQVSSQPLDDTVEDFVGETVKVAKSPRGNDFGTFLGVGLVLFGLYYLVRMMAPDIADLNTMLLALILIIGGGYLIIKKKG